MTKPLPNWAIWLHMPTLTTHQAMCLSFGLEPSRITAYDRTGKSWGWSANRLFHSVPGFNDRQTLFSACHRGGLSALELSKWAQSVGWNIPTELAKLAPVPVDALEALPAETVRTALLEVIAPSADIEELQKEIARAGIIFTMRDGVETVEIPDGMVRGRKEPLSGIYRVLAALDGPKVRKLHTLIRGSGSSGSGATASNYQPAPAAHVSAHAMAAPGHQATTQAPPLVEVGALGGKEPVKAGPLPLTTGDIAYCFAGLRWKTEAEWKKPLGDKPKWLAACIAIPGVQGVSETRWNPVLIGAALANNGRSKTNSIRAKFQTMPQLAAWLEAWKTYEAEYFDSP